MAADDDDRQHQGRGRENDDREREPLLGNEREGPLDGGEGGDSRELLQFSDDDKENPRNWKYGTKMLNVAVIASMSILSPLASSMFTPGIDQIAEGLDTTTDMVIACTTGFVVMLGIGPLLLVGVLDSVWKACANGV